MAKINYANKTQAAAYDASKWNADDANEVKAAVNDLYDDVAEIPTAESALVETDKIYAAVPHIVKPSYQEIFVNSQGDASGTGSYRQIVTDARAQTILDNFPVNRIPKLLLLRGDTVQPFNFLTSGREEVRSLITHYGDAEAKPIIDASINLASLSWVDQGSNVWKAEAPAKVLNVWKGDVQLTVAKDDNAGEYHTFANLNNTLGTIEIPTLDRPSGEVANTRLVTRGMKFYYLHKYITAWDNTTKVATLNSVFHDNWTGSQLLGYLDGMTTYLSNQDDWVYVDNGGVHEVYIYSTTNPNTFTDFRGSIHEFNINFGSNAVSHVEISGIELSYAGLNAINADNGQLSQTSITDNDISHALKQGIHIYNASQGQNIEIARNNISLCGVGAVMARHLKKSKVMNNIITDIFTQQEYGWVVQNEFNEHDLGQAVSIINPGTSASNIFNEFAYNKLQNLGSGGIVATGEGNSIHHNVIDTFSTQIDDCGAIYMVLDRSKRANVFKNIIRNGIGSTRMYNYGYLYSWLVNGIYLDNASLENTVFENVIYNCVGKGIMLNRHTRRDAVERNIVVGCGIQMHIAEDSNPGENQGHSVTNNLFVCTSPEQIAVSLFNSLNSPFSPGYLGANKIIQPYNTITHSVQLSSAVSFYTLDQFKVDQSQEVGSEHVDISLDSVFSSLTLGAEKVTANPTFDTDINSTFISPGANLTKSHNPTGIDDGSLKILHFDNTTRDDIAMIIDEQWVDSEHTQGNLYLFEFSIISETADIGEVELTLTFSGQVKYKARAGFNAERRVYQFLYLHFDPDVIAGNDFEIKIKHWYEGETQEFDLGYTSYREVLDFTSGDIELVVNEETKRGLYQENMILTDGKPSHHLILDEYEGAVIVNDTGSRTSYKP